MAQLRHKMNHRWSSQRQIQDRSMGSCNVLQQAITSLESKICEIKPENIRPKSRQETKDQRHHKFQPQISNPSSIQTNREDQQLLIELAQLISTEYHWTNHQKIIVFSSNLTLKRRWSASHNWWKGYLKMLMLTKRGSFVEDSPWIPRKEPSSKLYKIQISHLRIL